MRIAYQGEPGAYSEAAALRFSPSATTLPCTSFDEVFASVDTGNIDRDNHVRSADLLHVERRPTMTFRSTRIDGDDTAWLVDGDLTIGDVTHPFSLDVAFGGLESFVDGTRHAGFEAKGELRRTDFGIDLPGGIGGAMLGDVVRVELDVELIEPAS